MSQTEHAFFSRAEKSSGCWIWKKKLHKTGYAYCLINGRQTRAHRHAYELVNGKIGDGLMVCHTCDNRACINPDHLYAGTARDNRRDGVTHGQNKFKVAENNFNGVVTDAQVSQMFGMRRRGFKLREIAEKFNISRPHVSNILRGNKRVMSLELKRETIGDSP